MGTFIGRGWDRMTKKNSETKTKTKTKKVDLELLEKVLTKYRETHGSGTLQCTEYQGTIFFEIEEYSAEDGSYCMYDNLAECIEDAAKTLKIKG